MVHTLRLDNYTPIPRKLVLGTNSSFGTESIKIERGAGWDGLNLTATWHIPGREEPLRVALLDGDAMDVPPEVTKEAKDGVLVLAGLASGVQRASCNVEYLILEQAGVYGGADAEPTPELAAQVLEAALQAKADAEAAAEDAAAAKANADKARSDAEKHSRRRIKLRRMLPRPGRMQRPRGLPKKRQSRPGMKRLPRSRRRKIPRQRRKRRQRVRKMPRRLRWLRRKMLRPARLLLQTVRPLPRPVKMQLQRARQMPTALPTASRIPWHKFPRTRRRLVS